MGWNSSLIGALLQRSLSPSLRGCLHHGPWSRALLP
jgi:hypothetical protein